MITALIILTVLILLILFLLAGRRNHPGLEKLRGWSYAHRGLHGNGIPENSMGAFRAALEKGYGIEFDVHLMKDGELAVIHDSSLKRTAGVDIRIEDLTKEDLEKYPLEGTEEKIPLLQDLLALYAGKAPLIVELKPEKGNHTALGKAVCDMLEGYEGVYCMESFDPRTVAWLKKNRPQIIRGQLSYNYFSKKGFLPWPLKVLLTFSLVHAIARPDFTAYKYCDRNMFTTTLCRKVLGIQGVSWTIKTQEEYDIAVKDGWIPIFEGFTP